MPGNLVLKRGEERRIRVGHLWIYADEAAHVHVDAPGALVHVRDSRGHVLGTAYANPNSKILARMMSRKALDELKPAWWRQRLQEALLRREWLFDSPHYRWVHGEGDKLPGLVIDRFGEDLVIQAHTAGIEVQMPRIIEAAAALIRPANIYLNNKVASRRLEGLDCGVERVMGSGDGEICAREGGAHMHAQALSGQKTGYFYDQRPNRAWVRRHCQGREVLDLFSYVGAFAVQALLGGAVSVTSVDASETALAWARHNVALAAMEAKWRGVRGDVMQTLRQMRDAGERFDIVICDPPAYVKSRARLRQGLRGYQHLAEAAARVVRPGGMLCCASCSGVVGEDEFRRATMAGVRAAGRAGQVVYAGGAGADHPWLPAMPESRYLKFLAMFLD